MQLKTNDSSSHTGGSKKFGISCWGKICFRNCDFGKYFRSELVGTPSIGKDKEILYKGCVTENPFFAFDKVCIFFLCRSF